MNDTASNVDPAEIDKFSALANRWWDPQGEFRTLHDINPLRLGFIDERSPLAGLRVADIGCGGGLLSEAMARRGASVTAIDLAEAPLEVARLHAIESGVEVDYRLCSAEQLASEEAGGFEVVTCLEMLEHVPDPAAVVEACVHLLRPGGHLYVATINRNPKAFLLAIVGAEHVLRMLPAGTHEYARFIQPAELAAWLRGAGARLGDMAGISYNPVTRRFRLGDDVDVNYLVHAVREP